VVGLGPGNREHLTPRAIEAIAQAQVVIGYRSYIPFIEDLLDGKEVISLGMHRELERARAACRIAREGKTVAVVSSGDPGVYGMAGLVLELAKDVDVEIVPGVTAATAAASILGAPLTHDFAVISLSDLLTPWDKIDKRLKAAAEGDFVIVLFNPRSKGRQEQIQLARQVIMNYREPQTPVGIVRNAKRAEEKAIITDLGQMLKEDIDMRTTIIIGNSQTVIINGRMVTPRGYLL
jgi:precorrin-3B C17-methyltransferase